MLIYADHGPVQTPGPVQKGMLLLYSFQATDFYNIKHDNNYSENILLFCVLSHC